MPSVAEASTPFDRRTRVIAVLDVVESVRLMEQDEHGFIQRWHEFVQFARQLLPQYGGRMHKSLGDGLMLEFADARGCLQSAFAFQDWCAATNKTLPGSEHMQLRVGAHQADFVADEYDIYGSDVNLTARIANVAGPGEIVVSAALRDRLAAGLDADIEDLGPCYLKHVKEPVRIYRVGHVGPAPVVAPGSGMQIELRPSIAVIPFAVQTADAGNDMLGEALADEVIAALSRTSELSVISRLSTTVFRNRPGALEDVRSLLGAHYVLSGTCRSAGDLLVLFAELLDTTNGHVVWAGSLKGKLQGLFMPDDDLISELVGATSSAVMSHQLKRARGNALPGLESYSLMLGAIALMHRTAPNDFDRAKQLLDHLVDRARRHPVPYAWLAKWHVLRVQQGWSDNVDADTRIALDYTRRALDLEPECALALTVDGFVHTNLLKNLELATTKYEHALTVNPNESLAWLLMGTLHAFKGEGDVAMHATERALALSPLDPLRYFYDSLAASAALSAGDYARAIELAQRSLKANRTHTSTLRALAIAQSLHGDLDGARATIQRLLQLEPSFTVRGFLERSPSSRFEMGRVCADALRQAGLPE